MNTKSFMLLLIAVFLFTNCTKEEEPGNLNALEGTWSLIKKTGGFAGLDCNYQENLIVWTFGESSLEIVNNDNSGTICSGSLTGTFTYSILESEGEQFLQLDGQESGGITLTGDEMVIDQNKFSQGSGADGFVLMLKR